MSLSLLWSCLVSYHWKWFNASKWWGFSSYEIIFWIQFYSDCIKLAIDLKNMQDLMIRLQYIYLIYWIGGGYRKIDIGNWRWLFDERYWMLSPIPLKQPKYWRVKIWSYPHCWLVDLVKKIKSVVKSRLTGWDSYAAYFHTHDIRATSMLSKLVGAVETGDKQTICIDLIDKLLRI